MKGESITARFGNLEVFVNADGMEIVLEDPNGVGGQNKIVLSQDQARGLIEACWMFKEAKRHRTV